MDKNEVIHLIFKSIDEFNEQLSEGSKIEKSTETTLFGESGKLDSLGLVTLIVSIEQNIEDEFGKSMTIADEKAMSQKHSPFKTIDTLADYICMRLEKN